MWVEMEIVPDQKKKKKKSMTLTSGWSRIVWAKCSVSVTSYSL